MSYCYYSVSTLQVGKFRKWWIGRCDSQQREKTQALNEDLSIFKNTFPYYENLALQISMLVTNIIGIQWWGRKQASFWKGYKTDASIS